MTRLTSAPRLAKFMPQPPVTTSSHAIIPGPGTGMHGDGYLRGGDRAGRAPALLAGEHGGRLALEVEVRLAADVDRRPA